MESENSQIFILRTAPKFIVSLNKDGFTINDVSTRLNSGKYLFQNLKKIDLIDRHTNWLVTILSWASEIFTGTGGRYYKKARLVFHLTGHKLDLLLTNADLAEATQSRS